jgi:hypothetical protein
MHALHRTSRNGRRSKQQQNDIQVKSRQEITPHWLIINLMTVVEMRRTECFPVFNVELSDCLFDK